MVFAGRGRAKERERGLESAGFDEDEGALGGGLDEDLGPVSLKSCRLTDALRPEERLPEGGGDMRSSSSSSSSSSPL